MADITIQDRARSRKASKLVEALHEAGATAGNVVHLDEGGWAQAAKVAGVRPPSDRTRALVAGWFKEREQRPADVFVGLDDVA